MLQFQLLELTDDFILNFITRMNNINEVPRCSLPPPQRSKPNEFNLKNLQPFKIFVRRFDAYL